MAPPRSFEIRDPIHGAVGVSGDERAVVDHPFVQRLRGIRQLGFSHLPFPGATHSRYAHSIGAFHLAGAAFDAAVRDDPFSSPARRAALRSAVRLAALCHDLGHAPFSHAAEFAMPSLHALGIAACAPARVAGRLHQRASHEDYTVAILTGSSLAQTIAAHFPFSPLHVAALVSPDVDVPDDFFVDRGLDFRGLLSQLISSELDVDRLDYLGRDSYFSGARYGQVDVNWILSSLEWYVDGGFVSSVNVESGVVTKVRPGNGIAIDPRTFDLVVQMNEKDGVKLVRVGAGGETPVPFTKTRRSSVI